MGFGSSRYHERDKQPAPKKSNTKKFAMIGGGAVGVIILLLVISLLFGAFGFIMQKVDTNEVGLILKAGKPVELVGPGVYSRWGPFSYYDMEQINTSAIEFCAEDPEVLTTAEAEENPIRIGVKVCGSIFRPGLELGLQEFGKLFGKYRPMYLSDNPIVGFVDGDVFVEGIAQAKTQQAMKSCIGEGTFFDAAVGKSRDANALCHHTALNSLLTQYGFTVENVTVPNIGIPDEVGTALDAVAKAKFDAEAERELAEFARAQADRQQAEKEGAIRVIQSEIQERLRQDIETARLDKASTEAQLDVIEAKKVNELRAAQLDLEITQKLVEVALEQAGVDLARETILVALYNDNPDYMAYLVRLANAAALGRADKIIVPEGSILESVLSPSGEPVSAVVTPGG